MAVKPRRWDAHLTRELIYVPTADDNKYTHGVIGVVAGSKRFPGAALLSCKASLATGVGMVRFVGTASLNALVLAAAPSVVVAPGRVNAWVLGPGIPEYSPQDPNAIFRHRSMVLAYEERLPTVLDAGGLMVTDRYHEHTVLTPHAGELSALLATRGIEVSSHRIADNPLEWVQRASTVLGATVLLKGSRTCICRGDILIEMPISTPWLSTAGTGDVLAGIIGALAATHSEALIDQPHFIADVAAAGAYVHAVAADLLSQGGPITAEGLIRAIPDAVRSILQR